MEGDKNTKFLHKMASWRGALNLMNCLKVDGEWVYDQEQIRETAKQFYTNLYTGPFLSQPVLEGVDFDQIKEETSRRLERPFSREEIWTTLNTMEEDKALGPDGFPIKFLLACWDVVGRMCLLCSHNFIRRINGVKV